MKKKTIANLIMAAIILAIVITGILCAGYFLGWFDSGEETLRLTGLRGIIHVERDGLAFPAEDPTVLRQGDTLICTPGASAVLLVSDSDYIVIGENAEAEIITAEVSSPTVRLIDGEAFVSAEGTITMELGEDSIPVSAGICHFSMHTGAKTCSVFSGKVLSAEAGNTITWIGTDQTVGNCSVNSLNAFAITNLKQANQRVSSCFTNEQLEKVEEERFAQIREQLALAAKQNAPEPTPVEEAAPEPVSENGTASSNSEAAGQPASQPAKKTSTKTCYISIVCDTILDNWDSLKAGKGAYVPANGVILYSTKVEFTDGETVFDVLQRICKECGIQFEYSWTPMYNSYYVEGINHLYEFDCGTESGWMYKVNGWFPNYGCSSYKLTGGENIVWCYTCNGLGEDVGGGF